MTPEHEQLKLFESLRATGWQDEDDLLMAPGRSMWLNKVEPLPGSLQGFLEQMEGRLERFLRRDRELREDPTVVRFRGEAIADVAMLVACLRILTAE